MLSKHDLMKPRLFLPIFTFLLYGLMPDLNAQENQEPVHACFRINPDRVISISLKKAASDSKSFGCDFEFPDEGDGKQVFVRMPGSGTPYTLKINEFPFGTDPGSGLAAEYNITPFLKEQGNRIDLVPVPGDSMTRLKTSEPCSEAVLIVRDGIHVRDLVISSYMESEEKEALTRIHLYIKSYLTGKSKERTLDLKVTDPGGKQIFNETIELGAPLSFGQETEMNLDINIENPKTWSPVHPNLYQLEIEQTFQGKNIGETVTTHFGIRNAALTDSLMVFNGDTVQLHLADEEMTLALATLPEESVRDLIREKKFSAVLYDPILPCWLVNLFDREGAVLILTEEKQLHPASHAHVNAPSLVPAR